MHRSLFPATANRGDRYSIRGKRSPSNPILAYRGPPEFPAEIDILGVRVRQGCRQIILRFVLRPISRGNSNCIAVALAPSVIGDRRRR